MKKIGLLLVESLPLPPTKGGAVENLVQMLIDNNEIYGDFEFYVFSKHDSAAEEKSKTYNKTHYRYYNPIGFLRLIDFIFKVLRRIFRICFGIASPSYYEVLAKRYFKSHGVKTIVIENAPHYSVYVNKNKEFEIVQHLHNDYLNTPSKQNTQIFNSSQRIIAVSNFIQSRLQPIVPPHIPINVCYNGIKLEKFVGSLEEKKKLHLQQQYGLSLTDKVIVYTGRLVENKGVKELLLAFESVVERHDDLKLLIVGGQSYSNNNKDKYVQELDDIASRMPEKVIFTGYVDYTCIVDYLKLSTIAVVPSICNESFSLSTLEAMAAGLPVIVSDAGGMLEVIDEESGVVVARGDQFVERLAYAIESILFDDSKLKSMSIAAICRSRRFSDSEMYKTFENIV